MVAKDPLSGSISVQAAVTDSGIKASAKSRFLVAVDRLLGAVIDWPTSYVEAKASRRRLEEELAQRRMKQAATICLKSESDIARLEASVSLAARESEARKYLNQQSVVIEALEDLRNGPTPEEVTDNIDEDWLNVFSDYAAKASSERLRSLWGKILAGEIRRPGSCSLLTLRVLSEVDQHTAALFQNYVKDVLDRFVIRSSASQGQELMDLTALEDAGLLQGVGTGMGLTQTFNENGDYTQMQGNLILIAKGSPSSSFRFDVISLSKAGKELWDLLPKENDDKALRAVARLIHAKCETITLALITNRLADGRINYQPIESLK